MKDVKVVFENDELEKAYVDLPENDRLKKKIDWVIEKIKEKPAFGQPIAKRLIPEEYRQKGIDNAFWVELSKEWRLIYSLKSFSEIEIVGIILEWFTRHKDYERKFGYG